MIAAEQVFYRHHPVPVDPPNPDAVLLDICARLRCRQDRWQQLWEPTGPDIDSDTPADRRWFKYNTEVWPGTGHGHGRGLAGRLLRLPARTPEGLAAKAAALCAMDDAAGYTGNARMDSCEIALAMARDAAGSRYRPLGEQA